MIVFDNHLHLQLRGENVIAAKRFKKEGGTHFNLTNVADYTLPLDGNYYRKIYDTTVNLAERVRSEVGITVLVTLGPYPVDLVELVKRGKSIDEGERFLLEGLYLAEKYVEENKANAIGEVGRPHFPVSEEIWEASNRIIVESMKIAKSHRIPVILHTESATEQTWKDLARFADEAGIDRNMVIKHYSPPIVDSRNFGIFPSVIASRKNVRESLKQGTRFLLETDFMDEPTRKNAVLPIESVPRRARFVVQEYGEETWEKIMDNMRVIYRIEE